MRRMIPLVSLCCFVFSLAVSQPYSSSLYTKPASLCGKNEQVIFSCLMQKSAKLLSLCGSQELDAQKGYVQYRFGNPGKIELEYPAERKDTQSAFSYSRYTRPLVTYLSLRFETNGYEYSIHQDDVEDIKPAVRESYISIAAPGKEAVEMKCRQPVNGSLMKLEDIVPNKDEDQPPTEP